MTGLLRLAVVMGAATLLELACRLGVIGRLTMIPPSEMVAAAVQELALPATREDLLFTLANVAAAAVAAIVGGFALGSGLHALPRLRHASAPLLASWYAVPTFVFYPLLIVLFGLTRAPLIVLGMLSGVVAMLAATLDGLDRLPPAVIKTGRALRLGPVRTALLLRLPAAIPHLLTGAKLAIAYAVIGVVAAEFILATAGIGRRIVLAFNDLDNRAMYGQLVLLLAVVAVVNGAVRIGERRLYARWGRL